MIGNGSVVDLVDPRAGDLVSDARLDLARVIHTHYFVGKGAL